MDAIGRTGWALAEGYIHQAARGRPRQMISHETICLLNTPDKDAEVSITVLPPDADYASVVESTVPIVVQQTRLAPDKLKMPSSVPWPSGPK